MIDENQFGYRDKRGHFVPKEAADKNPIWIIPLNIKKIFNWFVFSYVASWNLFYLFVAFIAYYFFTPPMSEMKSLSIGWIFEILFRNYIIGTIFFSLNSNFETRYMITVIPFIELLVVMFIIYSLNKEK